MAILKSKIKNKFSTVPNSVIQAKDVTDAEYRLLLFLHSLPDDWKINQNYLGVELNCSRININKKLKRLKELGYLEILKNSETKENDFIYVLKEKDVSVNDTEGVSLNDVSVSDVSLSNVSVSDTYTNTYITNTYKTNNNINKNIKERNIKERFLKPTVEELKKYCDEKSLKVDCEYFYDYYESNGWTVGKSKMKDWKATLRNWDRRNDVVKKENPDEIIKTEIYDKVRYGITRNGQRIAMGIANE